MENNPTSRPTAQDREEIFFGMALDKPASERVAFLDAICGQDEALRKRLGVLLAAHAGNSPFVEMEGPRQTIKIGAPEAPDEAVGLMLGRYKLLEKVGEGGCGVVYVAEQTAPVRRRVALKVIKLGMDTRRWWLDSKPSVKHWR